jgi:PQQ enzyme repeat
LERGARKRIPVDNKFCETFIYPFFACPCGAMERSPSSQRAGERYSVSQPRFAGWSLHRFRIHAGRSRESDAQPLYIEDGPGGRAMIIVVTESNNVYALDAVDGSVIWEHNVGPPVSADDLICTKFDPMGITGTPIVDLASRALFLDTMITPDGGETKKHLIFSLNVDRGDINPGWPVDVEATASYDGINFVAEVQQQRPALGIVGNILYVGYGSMRDCSIFHGWLVGVPIDNPASVTAWAAGGGGRWGGAIWGVGGVASDGMNPFVTTGNTANTGGTWSGGEAVIRFQPGPVFSGDPADYWAPTNWQSLDQIDADVGASGPLLVDVPGATPSHLVVALSKDRNAYLVNRDNLGGISAPIAESQVADSTILRQPSPIGPDRAPMSRSAPTTMATPFSPLSALLRPIRLPSTSPAVGV